jgi:hypothetical protein
MAKRRKGGSRNFLSSLATTKCSSIIDSSKAPSLGQDAQQLEDVLLGLLELLVDEGGLDVWGLACLGSCSKACKRAASTLLEKRAKFMLPATVKQAAASAMPDSCSKAKYAKAVLWMLGDAASGCRRFNLWFLAAPATAAQFLSINNVPTQLALAILQAGLRFSYEQFMQAVRARTAGVEVWVSAAVKSPLPWARAWEKALDRYMPFWLRDLCSFHQLVRRLHRNRTTLLTCKLLGIGFCSCRQLISGAQQPANNPMHVQHHVIQLCPT